MQGCPKMHSFLSKSCFDTLIKICFVFQHTKYHYEERVGSQRQACNSRSKLVFIMTNFYPSLENLLCISSAAFTFLSRDHSTDKTDDTKMTFQLVPDTDRRSLFSCHRRIAQPATLMSALSDTAKNSQISHIAVF